MTQPAEQAAREWFDERARLCEGVDADLRSLGDLLLTREQTARREEREQCAEVARQHGGGLECYDHWCAGKIAAEIRRDP